MQEIEQNISPLIANMFPSFYQEEGPNFVLFLQAYYEWLEQNHQVLELEDYTNFNIGDTIYQDDVSGVIINYTEEGDILVLVNGLNTFKCITVCSDLILVTSSSGGSSYIKKGGSTKRYGAIYFARKLTNIRDIDKTLDLFIVRFKEKYLKNIEFDTKTNKRLLIKNSLDLYRSKGTQRSIDLFFRLVYGINADVYYPADDLFRLSDAEWVKPAYIEITSNSVDRAIQLVGKQITGVTSKATAFVEKYIKRKVNDGYVHILYISNYSGEFLLKEILKGDTIYSDSPRVLGSLTSVEVKKRSNNFKVGDIVSLNSTTGIKSLARVAAISSISGQVDFELIDSGYGYTINSGNIDPYFTKSRSQTITSQNIITLENILVGNNVIGLNVITAGSGYSNTDVITINSNYTDAKARPITNGSGAITSVVVTNYGTGFFSNPTISIANSIGGASAGSLATFTSNFSQPKQYFNYLENITQNKATIIYDNATSITELDVGLNVSIGNSSVIIAHGVILNNKEDINANGTMIIAIANNNTIGVGNTIYLDSNIAVTANIGSFTDSSVLSNIMYVSNTATIKVLLPLGNFNVDDNIYQLNSAGFEVASADIVSVNVNPIDGYFELKNLQGVFVPNLKVYSRSNVANAVFDNISLRIGVYNGSNTVSSANVPMYSSSGILGIPTGTTLGTNAAFKIGTLVNKESIRLNTDDLSNTSIMGTNLSAVAYNLPNDTTANLSSIIFGGLTFDTFEIGSVDILTEINPGTDYNTDQVTSMHQPYITGFHNKDYIFDITNLTGSFGIGEKIEQTSIENRYVLSVDSTPFEIGERVYFSNTSLTYVANATVLSIDSLANLVIVNNFEGTIPNASSVTGFVSMTDAILLEATPTVTNITAQAIIKSFSDTQITAKRIQFDNKFVTNKLVTGTSTGSSANVISIVSDQTTRDLGFNASTSADVLAAVGGNVIDLQVVDSGFGFHEGQSLIFTSEDGTRSGTAIGFNQGIGIGSGYYRTSKGFLSSLSKLFDGDYYQEYSYDIISRFPLDKYADMFKKVMHTSGTRFFGSVLIDTVTENQLNIKVIPNTEIEISNISPFVIYDYRPINIVDENESNIEVRE